MSTAEIMISVYENETPAYVGEELDRLHGSLYSSFTYFQIYGGADNVSTYVVRDSDQTRAVFLYKREGRRVQVINEGMKIAAQEMSRFADYVFSTFEYIDSIAFHAVQTEPHRLPYPHHRFFFNENFILTLPDSADAYLAHLGSATRKNIKRHKNRLERTFPTFRYRTYLKDEVDEQQVRDIIDLNRARMARKNKISSIDEDETQRIIRLVKECGLVGVATIDGRVCAGAITFRIGENFISRVNAHDPQYDDFRLGILCCYFTICDCIARGGKEFHFMSGKYEYKNALLGKCERFDKVVLYRSRLHKVRNSGMAVKMLATGSVHSAREWLSPRLKKSCNPLWRAAVRCVSAWRALKQH
jgi:hypothetical protein